MADKPKIGLFYGSSTGAGETAANIIKSEIEASGLAEVEMFIVSAQNLKAMEKYQYLIFGCSTWNIGELQDDWNLKFNELDIVDFKGRKVALFGNGDQYGYSNSFVDAIGIIGHKIAAQGADLIDLGAESTLLHADRVVGPVGEPRERLRRGWQQQVAGSGRGFPVDADQATIGAPGLLTGHLLLDDRG